MCAKQFELRPFSCFKITQMVINMVKIMIFPSRFYLIIDALRPAACGWSGRGAGWRGARPALAAPLTLEERRQKDAVSGTP